MPQGIVVSLVDIFKFIRYICKFTRIQTVEENKFDKITHFNSEK